MDFNILCKLASEFQKLASEVDTLENYPGEDSSIRSKFEAANKAAEEDINNVQQVYYANQAQVNQATRNMVHQLKLLEIAKEIKKIIIEFHGKDEVDLDLLRDKIHKIKEKALKLGEYSGIRISLSELQSLRLLQAIIHDEAAKSLPKLPPVDWIELARLNKKEVEEEPIPPTKRAPYSNF